MCMLFGINAKEKRRIGHILQEFFQYSYIHAHGWGVVAYTENGIEVTKEVGQAIRSFKARNMKLITNNMLAHIRYASVGELALKNTHPFIKEINGEDWSFIHNGTINSEAFNLDIYTDEKGTTDSEKAFEYIAHVIKNGGNPEDIEKMAKYIAGYGKFNFILTNGELMYVFCSKVDTLYKYIDNEVVCICTKPLKFVQDYHKWKALEENKLVIFEKGKLFNP